MSLFKQLIVRSEDKDGAEDDVAKKVSENDETDGVDVDKEEKETIKKVAKKIRVFDTSPNEDFWFHYGPVVKNLAELRDAFLKIDDELYDYHAKGEVNDFEKWIKDVFGYEELAKKVGSAKTRKRAYKILEGAIE